MVAVPVAVLSDHVHTTGDPESSPYRHPLRRRYSKFRPGLTESQGTGTRSVSSWNQLSTRIS